MEQTAAPATEPATSRKVFIKTYGCQMNVYDSQRMADQLTAEGYSGTEVLEDADLVLINTCHIREKAAEKVYSELGRIREIKKAKKAEGRDMLLGVTGCVAQAEGTEILRREKGRRHGHRPADLSPPAVDPAPGGEGRARHRQ